MAKTLKAVVGKIDEIENSKWRFSEREAEVAERIEGLSFEGELLKNDLFLSFPVSIRDPKTHVSQPMTKEEIDEYIESGDVLEKHDWTIDNWIVCRFDMDKDYIRIFETPMVSFDLDPKENYERAYLRTKEYKDIPNEPHIYEINLKDYEYAEAWLNLKKAAAWMRKNPDVQTPLSERTKVSKTKYFQEFNKNLIDDIFENTGPTRKYPVAQNFKSVKLSRAAQNILTGMSFESPYYPESGIERFEDKHQLLDYFWSAIQFINDRYGKIIDSVWKVEKSNEWAIGEDFEDNTYTFRCTKVKDFPMVEATVFEDGTVYRIQNYSDEIDDTYYDNKLSDGR